MPRGRARRDSAHGQPARRGGLPRRDPGRPLAGAWSALLEHLIGLATERLLVGTWAAAAWAIRFYERHGFERTSPEQSAALLRAYWTIPDRQIETSVVLVKDSPIPAGR
jgi:GNAT superfamily N-acetyltransferase